MSHEHDWQKHALCRGLDPQLFYGEDYGEYIQAIKICNGTPARHRKPGIPGCPVKEQCLEWALANGERGVWAGTSENQRRRMRSKKFTNTLVSSRAIPLVFLDGKYRQIKEADHVIAGTDEG